MTTTFPTYTVALKGHERPSLVLNHRGETVAQVFTDAEPGDQYANALLFASANDLRNALSAMVGDYCQRSGWTGMNDAEARQDHLLARARAALLASYLG